MKERCNVLGNLGGRESAKEVPADAATLVDPILSPSQHLRCFLIAKRTSLEKNMTAKKRGSENLLRYDASRM